MNRSWSIQNGLIELSEGEKKIYPSALDLYGACEGSQIFYNNNEYFLQSEIDDFRFSSLVLNIKLSFEFCDQNSSLVINAVKGDVEYPVVRRDGFFSDYVIISNVWYSLGGDFKVIKDLTQGQDLKSIRYSDYLKLRRDLLRRQINFDDNLKDANFSHSECIFNPNDILATLYPYQEAGCKWLSFMISQSCGAILADEMGLGKTLQIISVVASLKNRLGAVNVLIVSPVSLLENWSRECERFCPSLKVLVHYGTRRTGYYGDLKEYDLVITSYGGVRSDLGMLNMIHWNLVVLDEAQNIKNPRAHRTRDIKNLKRKCSVAVTGTPFENHMTDLWSIVDFVSPGYFGKLSEFEGTFNDDMLSAVTIERFLTPIMIRRKVLDVAKDLPERIDIPIAVRMTRTEAAYYEAKRKEYTEADLSSLRIEMIQGLRMFCTHPSVYCPKLVNKDPFAISLKYQRLCEILEEISTSGEKVLIFTSFNDMISLMVEDLSKRFSCYVNFINGSTKVPDRQKIIDEFSSVEGTAVLVLNPKAAGAGLNITAANHVVHYNPEWNPAVEDQASARAYRRGQERKVFVYRLYYANTIEDVINDKIMSKRRIMTASVVGHHGDSEDDYKLRSLTISPYDCELEEFDEPS